MAEPRRKHVKKDEEAQVHIDLGFGELFKGLGNFLDLVSDLAEKGETLNRTGEIKFKGSDQLRGVYGFSIRTGIGGMPQVEHFGNIRETEEGPVVAESREPLVDVFDENGAYLIVVELPGVSEEEIQVEAKDDILSLVTTGARKYAKEILLPGAVNSATLKKAYKNGIFELRVEKAK
ncbi:MAG: Hsp20/alpha crystallin family protein [Chloroflexi bacterium]|nr:Hsp20/alpha crystallin family protein [Chloroflexota bacterium]